MSKVKVAPTALVAVTFLSFTACNSCSEESDEKAIEALFSFAVAAAERHDVGDLMDLTTARFTVARRGLSRQETKGILLMAFRRYGQFSIRHPRPAVEVSPSRATARAKSPFIIVREDREVPALEALYDDPSAWLEEVSEMADLYRIDLHLIKEEGVWRVEKASLDGLKSLESL